MKAIRKPIKPKECSQCGAERCLLFSMGKILDQSPIRKLVYTMKQQYLCKHCFIQRHLSSPRCSVAWDWDYEEGAK
jgi:hypothetical protein